MYSQYYSDDNSQHHTNPPPDFSNQSLHSFNPASMRHRLDLSPARGRRFGLGDDFGDSTINYSEESYGPNTTLDLNFPPPQSQTQHPNTTQMELHHIPTTTQLEPQHMARNEPRAHRVDDIHQDLSHWAQGKYRMINGYCVPAHQVGFQKQQESPPSMSSIRPETGTLASLVAQGWAFNLQAPMKRGQATGLNAICR